MKALYEKIMIEKERFIKGELLKIYDWKEGLNSLLRMLLHPYIHLLSAMFNAQGCLWCTIFRGGGVVF